jgi:hypothetical protein
MLKSLAVVTALVPAAAIAVALILFAIIDGPGQMAHAGPGDVTRVAIDTVIDDDGDQHEDGSQGSAGDDECTDGIDNDADTATDANDTDCQTGQYLDNDDTVIGTIDNCFQLSAIGDTLAFDLVVQGVDAEDRIAGYQVDIDFDPSVINIIGVTDVDAAGSTPPDNVSIISRLQSGGGAGFQSLSEFVADWNPDTDGSFETVAQDATAVPNSDPANRHEDGEGVLSRITVEAVGAGVSPLLIPGPLGGIPSNGVPELIIIAGDGPYVALPIPVENVGVAAISVGQVCVAPTPTPTPTPTATPTPTPTPTPTGGATPTPTATPAGTTTPTPAGTATPAPTGTGTPTATATPTGTPAGAPSAGPPTGDGIPVDEGGGSVLPWLFVGLGAAIAVAATGYATYSARSEFASLGGRTRRRLSH